MPYIFLIIMVKKKKSVKKNKSSSKSKTLTDKNVLDEIIRVDHAGEYGATRIYDGQIAIFGKIPKLVKQFNTWLIKKKNILTNLMSF